MKNKENDLLYMKTRWKYCKSLNQLDELKEDIRKYSLEGNVEVLVYLIDKIKEKILFPNSFMLSESDLYFSLQYYDYKIDKKINYIDLHDTLVVKKCEELLVLLIVALSLNEKKDKRIEDVLNKLSNCDDEICRLYCCGRLKNPEKFLNDKSERIQKLAQKRVDFEKDWSEMAESKKQIIESFSEAISNGIIVPVDLYTDGFYEEMYTYVEFRGPIFENGVCDWLHFTDRDILYAIGDTRIIASELVDLIEENEIMLTGSVAEGIRR